LIVAQPRPRRLRRDPANIDAALTYYALTYYALTYYALIYHVLIYHALIYCAWPQVRTPLFF
jgi:hypothetical protein